MGGGYMKTFSHLYKQTISIENLLQAWIEFKKGKRKKPDVGEFERHLEDNLFALHEELSIKKYRHGKYTDFFISDPKVRHIHKATVKDRVVHHVLYTHLYNLFDKSFIYDSYSCRLEKGTHKAVKRLEKLARIVSNNYTKPCWTLKLDIKKFFASVEHQTLLNLLKNRIQDEHILWLLCEIINSFHSEYGKDKGIPLGNLTSQVFSNIYMNELDQFVKHKLRITYYIRYADDFVILAADKISFNLYINLIKEFLMNELKLELHPNKIIIRNLQWGIDFLGYIVLPHYILPRTKTKRRIFKKLKQKIEELKNGQISQDSFNQSLQSYLGYLGHANSFRLTQKLKNQVWFWKSGIFSYKAPSVFFLNMLQYFL